MHQKRLFAFLCIFVLLLGGCASRVSQKENDSENFSSENPLIPQKLSVNSEGIPLLKVYQIDEENVIQMNIEDYLQGVLAGEMKNDWPMEALKAQAVLARTFVLKFCSEKESKYPDADISTDIEEAQAYDATGINSRIEEAVSQTQGLVLTSNGKLPYTWFHAHSGGRTALAQEGLNYQKEEPDYTQSTEGKDSDKAPDDAKNWKADFSKDEVLKALKSCGTETKRIDSVAIGETGESGRAVTLLINDEKEVSAADLRIALGSTKMRSTLLTNCEWKDNQLHLSGKGYGHGVGMPQWGAYALAEEGKSAEDIVKYYFRNTETEKLW